MSKTASWNGQILAKADTWQEVEGNIYFPPDSINWEFFTESTTTTKCPWKGLAHYYSLKVDGKENLDAAWTYHQPSEAASNIKDYVAFWNGVEIQ